MQSNLEKYKVDLKKLTATGKILQIAMEYECYPEQVKSLYDKKEAGKQLLKDLPTPIRERQIAEEEEG